MKNRCEAVSGQGDDKVLGGAGGRVVEIAMDLVIGKA
jgi:hypothetical protein